MDDYYFEQHVRNCTVVEENTKFFQVFNYANGESESDMGSLPESEFDNFLEQKGVFELPKHKGTTIVSGMRLVLQVGAKHKDTFTTQYISLSHSQYIAMVRKLHLPYRGIETSSVVGPFFWSAVDLDDANPHQQILFRKSDVRKKGLTRGWELMLSHAFRTGITTGYAKGTDSSKLARLIEEHLRACASPVAHPFLLPTIIMDQELGLDMDDKQRKIRDWLRKLENVITDRNEVAPGEALEDFNLDGWNRDLVECHSQVLWKRPQAFIDILDDLVRAMKLFCETREHLLRDGLLYASIEDGEDGAGADGAAGADHSHRRQRHSFDPATEATLDKLHRSMLNRFEFYRQKLRGIQHYSKTTVARLDIQRGALYNIIAQKESKLNLEMAKHQRLLALAAKRDSQSMKALSVVGAVFLPATYLASVFSMTFFNFQGGGGGGGSSNASSSDVADPPTVAPTLWIYFVVTVPLTLIVLGMLLWWEKKREKQFAVEEITIEEGIPHLEKRVLSSLREKKTGLQSMDTKRWDTM